MRKYAATTSNNRLTIEIIIVYSIPLEYYMVYYGSVKFVYGVYEIKIFCYLSPEMPEAIKRTLLVNLPLCSIHPAEKNSGNTASLLPCMRRSAI